MIFRHKHELLKNPLYLPSIGNILKFFMFKNKFKLLEIFLGIPLSGHITPTTFSYNDGPIAHLKKCLVQRPFVVASNVEISHIVNGHFRSFPYFTRRMLKT